MDKRLFLQLNGKRKLTGILRGYDPFMNIVLDDCVEETDPKNKVDIGRAMIRGSAIIMLETLERM